VERERGQNRSSSPESWRQVAVNPSATAAGHRQSPTMEQERITFAAPTVASPLRPPGASRVAWFELQHWISPGASPHSAFRSSLKFTSHSADKKHHVGTFSEDVCPFCWEPGWATYSVTAGFWFRRRPRRRLDETET
jgi:hypothetical protein